jgi:glycosyltransferase involved in cell wall biosynthesis
MRRIVIAVGSLKYEKGYWHLIRAFSKVLESCKDVQLVILGEGNDQNRKNLASLVKTLQIESSISFLGFDANPYKFIHKSDLYVLSSISEGFPNSLVEAMACGVPVVATDCKTGPREILSLDIRQDLFDVEFAEYGVLVPPLEKEEIYDNRVLTAGEILLSDTLLRMLNDSKKREHYRTRAFERSKQFSYERWQEAITSLFEEVGGTS